MLDVGCEGFLIHSILCTLGTNVLIVWYSYAAITQVIAVHLQSCFECNLLKKEIIETFNSEWLFFYILGLLTQFPLYHVLNNFECIRSDDHPSFGEMEMTVPPLGCTFSTGKGFGSDVNYLSFRVRITYTHVGNDYSL